MDTGRIVEGVNALGMQVECEVDSDVLVTEQRLIYAFGWSPEQARQAAASLVHVALNASCPCCDAEDRQ